MAFTSVALVTGAAALASGLFKEKPSRAQEIMQLESFSQAEIKANPRLKIVQNELNTYITGIKDAKFHPTLLEIITTLNKPVGFFSHLEGKLELDSPYNIKIKEQSLIKRIYGYLSDPNSFLSYMTFLAIAFITILLSIDMGKENNSLAEATSIILSAISGFMLYNWFSSMASIWHKSVHKSSHKDYAKIFKDYADKKTNKPSI